MSDLDVNAVPIPSRHDRAGVIPVLRPQPQHQSQREQFGPGRFPAMDQDGHEIGLRWLDHLLQTLERRPDINEACVIFRSQKQRVGMNGQSQFLDGIPLDRLFVHVIHVDQHVFG